MTSPVFPDDCVLVHIRGTEWELRAPDGTVVARLILDVQPAGARLGH